MVKESKLLLFLFSVLFSSFNELQALETDVQRQFYEELPSGFPDARSALDVINDNDEDILRIRQRRSPFNNRQENGFGDRRLANCFCNHEPCPCNGGGSFPPKQNPFRNRQRRSPFDNQRNSGIGDRGIMNCICNHEPCPCHRKGTYLPNQSSFRGRYRRSPFESRPIQVNPQNGGRFPVPCNCFRPPCPCGGVKFPPTQPRNNKQSTFGRFRREAQNQESNTRGMVYGTKTFGPNSHGGWQSTAKIEHDVWKSNDGNSRVTAYGRHDRIDGGRFDGFKESKVGIGLERRFRREAQNQESNTRGMIYGTKTFGPNSHGGWQSTAKIEHDVWKSNDGNSRVTAYGRHDRIDGGRFDGFKESKVGIGLERRF